MADRVELHGEMYEVDIDGDTLTGSRLVPLVVSGNVMTLQQAEDAAIRSALKHCNGNRTKAAKILDVDRRTLYRKIERMARTSA
jgi:transcriptional regulator of acetoin/glycerol metabolism